MPTSPMTTCRSMARARADREGAQVAQEAQEATEPDPGPVTASESPEATKATWVRMRTIFGESVMPPESAAIVLRAVRRAVAVGDVSPKARWQIVERWAADYLANEYALQAWNRIVAEANNEPPTQGEP